MDLSMRLNFLFGSEDYVRMRRQLVLVREHLMTHRHRVDGIGAICSGSLGEGVAYPTSDDDVMTYSIKYRVVKTYREATQSYDLLMVPSEFSPGYCLLLDVKGSNPYLLIHEINEMPFLSSSLSKELLVRDGTVIHGPCISAIIGSGEYDLAFCIRCNTWPDVAYKWLTRNRSFNWPSSDMIRNIVQSGCHVVPIGDQHSPNCHHEWRISFSVAERTLMHSFNHAQFLIYNLLRLTLKRIIEREVPDVLCSYFMKTTLFYTAENTPVELWRVDNLETCFKSCLSVLFDYVYHTYCPNYFIPDYNMIKHKINLLNRHKILDIIRYVRTIGIIGVIHVSGESFCLDDGLSTRMIECKLDREFMFSDHLLSVFLEIGTMFEVITTEEIAHFIFHINSFWYFLKPSSTVTWNQIPNIILKRGMTNACQHMLHRLSIATQQNKHVYRLYKRIQSLLKIGYSGDLTSGKLSMATYMYIMGRTDSALRIIGKLLSAYPPYVIDRCLDDLREETYKVVMCGSGYSIDYKMRRSYAPEFILYKQCLNAFPCPLRIWISIMNVYELDALTYTFFLQCLCYAQQNNSLLLSKSTRCFITLINDFKRGIDKAVAKLCVGIVKYIQGDNQSACRWLGSAYVMKDTVPAPYDENFSLSAMTYISCLLNRQFRSEFL